MNSDDYLPRVLEDDSQPEVPLLPDASKWVGVHDALELTTNTIGSRSRTGSLFTVAWVLGLTLGLVWVWRNGRTVFQQWQENVHRRANRRQHGIPNDDDRPFNVAYAAAALARKQREEKQQAATPQTPRRHPLQPGTGPQGHGASAGLRQRPLHADSASASSGHNMQTVFLQGNSTNPSAIPGGEFVARSSANSASRLPTVEGQDLSDPYNPDRGRDLSKSGVQSAAQGPQFGSSSVDANGRKLSDNTEGEHSLPERRKHRHEDDNDDDEDRTSKRTRVDGEDFIDGDNDAPWMPGGSRRPSLQVLKRGSKRHANHEDEGDWEMSQDKRARKGSLAVPESDVMDDDDVDMAHESLDAELQPTRGTKRDRDGPDSVGDDPAEDLDELHGSQPLRKRRADERERADGTSSRSRKRDRSPERPASSDKGGESDAQAARHKRGRRQKGREEDGVMDSADGSGSDDIPDFTEDPACGGRQVGEIWEVNGQSFKVGLDGCRLRHALVKQQRSKFPMPKDSAHNDARTNVDVVVEKWLNDEEYKAVKERFELAWQDSSPANTPIKAEPTMEDEQPSVGKRLLWGGPPPSPVKGRASISSSSIQNPFDLAPNNIGRRVASAHLLMNNLGESPKLRSSKSFSKWEKQDMEANSLKKMRARLEKEKEKEKEKKEQEQQEKEKEKTKSFLPPAAASTPLAPTTNKPTAEIKPTSAPVIATTVTQDTKATAIAAPSPFAKSPSDALAAPSLFVKPPLDSSATPPPFAKPASDTNSGSIPNFFANPATATITTAASGTTTQPSTSLMFPTSTQTATSSPAKIVPTAAKPSLTFAPPLTSASTPSEANKGVTSKPSFSFAPTSSTPSSVPATTSDTKPTFNFSAPPAQANISDPSKSQAFSFHPQTTSTSSGQGKSLTNSFAKPTSQPVSASFTPTGNSAFSFNQPSQSPKTATQTPPAFQFGIPSTPQNNSGKLSGTTSSSGSLLNRLGPAHASSEPSKATTTTQNAWSSPFGGPLSSGTSTNPPSTNIFGQTQLLLQQEASNPTESANKPSPFSPPGLSKTVFDQSSSTSATAPPAFSFAKPPATSDASKTIASSVFGKHSGQSDTPLSQQAAPSIFGKPTGQSDVSMSTPAAPIFGKPSGQPGALGTQSPGLSIFGKPTELSEISQPAPPSKFEKPSGQSVLASQSAASSIFGNSSGQSEASKSTLPSPSLFGNPGGQPEPSASQPKPAFSFSFGNNSISTSTPDAKPFNLAQIPQVPSISAQATPAVPNNFFGFGQSSSTTTSGTNAFGFSNKPTEGDKK